MAVVAYPPNKLRILLRDPTQGKEGAFDLGMIQEFQKNFRVSYNTGFRSVPVGYIAIRAYRS